MYNVNRRIINYAKQSTRYVHKPREERCCSVGLRVPKNVKMTLPENIQSWCVQNRDQSDCVKVTLHSSRSLVVKVAMSSHMSGHVTVTCTRHSGPVRSGRRVGKWTCDAKTPKREIPPF